MMPHRVYSNWLGDSLAHRLWEFAVAQEARFRPGTIVEDGRSSGEVDLSGRRSLVLRGLGPFDEVLRSKALAAQSDLERVFGMPHVLATEIEIEAAAHRDGHFYRSHIDTFTRIGSATDEARRLSLLYYFHRPPNRFSGGHLRLNALGSGQSISFAPVCDTLIAFPSFLPHEVEPVSCPGGRFADSRFSVNIWICGPSVKRAP